MDTNSSLDVTTVRPILISPPHVFRTVAPAASAFPSTLVKQELYSFSNLPAISPFCSGVFHSALLFTSLTRSVPS
jgi:hypothetical protein